MATSVPTAISNRLLRSVFRSGGSRPFALAPFVVLALAGGAEAFSQITREDGGLLRPDDVIVGPLPPLDPDRSGSGPDWGTTPSRTPPDGEPAAVPETGAADSAPLEIRYGDEALPRPVRDLRRRLVEIAESGEIERLRPFLETGSRPTTLSVIPVESDPIEFLRSASGDGEGVETLAILLETLEAGYVQVDAGEESEIFVWPYFTQVPLGELSPPQLVELFELVTAFDYAQMLDADAYTFYRVGISPEGRLEFFLAGD